MVEIDNPKFRIGKFLATPGALDALTEAGQTPKRLQFGISDVGLTKHSTWSHD